MRISVCFFLLGTGLFAQSSQSVASYGYDVNGRRVELESMGVAASNGSSASVQTLRNLNGREVPAESVEEKLVSEGPEGRVVERIVKKYDGNGRISGTEKQVVEERRSADGSATVSTSVFRSDINGRFALEERAVTRSQKSGDTTVAETVVERPTINGSLDLVEKTAMVSRGDDKLLNVETTVLRKDSSGALREAARQVAVTRVEDGKTTRQVDDYNTSATGRMDLTGQKVTTAVKNADGSETVITDVFGMTAPGRTSNASDGGPQLRERQIVDRRADSGGGVTETYSIQRAGLEDGRLGPVRKISEKVCSGDCIAKAKK